MQNYLIIKENKFQLSQNTPNNFITAREFSNNVSIEFCKITDGIIISEQKQRDFFLLCGESLFRSIHCSVILEDKCLFAISYIKEGLIDPKVNEYCGILVMDKKIQLKYINHLIHLMSNSGIFLEKGFIDLIKDKTKEKKVINEKDIAWLQNF